MNLIHGDTIEELKKIKSDSIDLIVTDPPYKTISGGNKKQFGNGFASSVLSKNDGKIFDFNDVNIKDYIGELYRILKEGTHCYIMTNNINLEEFLTESRKAGFGFHNLLIWEKGNKLMNGWYMKSFEPILFLRKGKAKRINNLGDDVILRHKNPTNKLHPTEKPVSLFKQMILNSSDPGDIVLDPFMGVGGCGVACIETNRNFIGFEIDKKYFDIAESKIQFYN